MPSRRKLGSYYPIPRAWKERVREKLSARGAQAAAARAIGCSQPSISVLLSDREDAPGTSRIARALAAHVGVPLPEDWDPDIAELAEEGQRLHEVNPAAVADAIAFIRRLREVLERSKIASDPKNPVPPNGQTVRSIRDAPGSGRRGRGE